MKIEDLIIAEFDIESKEKALEIIAERLNGEMCYLSLGGEEAHNEGIYQ